MPQVYLSARTPTLVGFHSLNRSVAQLGSALAWGASGRGFKSRHSDHTTKSPAMRGFFVFTVQLVGMELLPKKTRQQAGFWSWGC